MDRPWLLRFAIVPAVLGLLASAASGARAADGFEKVRCDRPIIPALIGARPRNDEAVVRIEARRKAIGLKDIGADEVDTGIGTITWQICGRRFVVLDVHDVWRDAVELPPASHDAPAFTTGTCLINGRAENGDFIGVFAHAADGAKTLPVKAAWRLDRRRNKFVPLAGDTSCAADGIYTIDSR